MTYKQKVMQLAKEHNLEVYTEGLYYSPGMAALEIYLPPGQCFEPGRHCIVVPHWPGESRETWKVAYQRLREELPYVEPCEDCKVEA